MSFSNRLNVWIASTNLPDKAFFFPGLSRVTTAIPENSSCCMVTRPLPEKNSDPPLKERDLPLNTDLRHVIVIGFRNMI